MAQVGIILALMLTSLRLSTCDYSGKSFQLTRDQDDNFKNPTTTASDCRWTTANKQFCYDTNSRCDHNCCSCTCDYSDSTFVRKTMKCRKNDEFRTGCKTKFINSYDGHRVKLLDLSKEGETEIYWKNEIYGDDVKSLNIDSMSWYHNSRKINTHFLTAEGKPKKSGSNWNIKIKWDKVPTIYNGEIFRVNTSHQIERKLRGGKYKINRKDCFVFKSSGSVTVTFPSSPQKTTSHPTDKTSSTTILPATSLASFTSPEVVVTTRKPTRKPTAPRKPPVITKDFSTQTVSSSTKLKPETHETRVPKPPIKASTSRPVVKPSRHSPCVEAREGDDGGDNTVMIPLVVVACLILLAAVGLLVFWVRRRSARASKGKETVIASRNADNPMMMSPCEGIYAEADNTVNYSSAHGKDNSVYDYAEGNVETNYTSLDESKVETKPVYHQSLLHNNVCEQIPVKDEGRPSNEKSPIAEPFYHVVDVPERTRDPGTIYHSVDETTKPGNYNTQNREMRGRTGNDDPERVYSILEDESETVEPEHFGRQIPGRSGDDNPERVYSVLEEDNADYVAVLHDGPEYEQPFNPPVPDA